MWESSSLIATVSSVWTALPDRRQIIKINVEYVSSQLQESLSTQEIGMEWWKSTICLEIFRLLSPNALTSINFRMRLISDTVTIFRINWPNIKNYWAALLMKILDWLIMWINFSRESLPPIEVSLKIFKIIRCMRIKIDQRIYLILLSSLQREWLLQVSRLGTTK